MRIPKEVKTAIEGWPGRWRALRITEAGLQVRYYRKGEAVAVHTRSGPGDYYYLWDVTRQ